MNLNCINNVSIKILNYNIPDNSFKFKITTTNSTDSSKNADYTDFSLNYTNDNITHILNNVKDSFDSTNLLSKDLMKAVEDNDSTAIENCAEKYGNILKDINNSNFDSNTANQLTSILDNSYDDLTEKISEQFSESISKFFNKSYLIKEAYIENNGNKIGMEGNKLLNQDDIENSINKMFSSAKTFYKNNSNGTVDEFNKYLDYNFSNTYSIEKLSYKDFTLLEKQLNSINATKDNDYNSISERLQADSKAMTNSLQALTTEGASSILIDNFEKAVNQNDNCNKRIGAYGQIRLAYEDELNNLLEQKMEAAEKLEALEKEREDAIEEYNKKMEELRHDSFKLYMLTASINEINSNYDPIKNLTEHHTNRLQIFEKQKNELEDRISDIDEISTGLFKSYEEFNKDPDSAIDDYLNMDENEQEEFFKNI